MPSAALLPPAPVPAAEARLAFAELLLGCDEARVCAAATVDWLARHARVGPSLCLVADDTDSHHLSPLAGQGVQGTERYVLSPHDAAHPLTAVFHQGRPRWLPPGQVPPELPLGRTGLFAFPLGRPGPKTLPVGLLLVTSPTPEPSLDVLWVAGHLGAHLTRLRQGRQLVRLEAASTELAARVNAATEELATQNELLRRQAIQLEQACAAKSQFLANMSHELRTPLNAMLGYTNMLLQGVSGELSAPQRRSLSRVDSNGRHLLEIINEILDITRIEAGRMPLHLSDFLLPELVQEVMAELEPIIARSRLAVSTALSPEFPQLHSDRQKVKQIIVNLLSNALKFTPQGSVRVLARYDAALDTVDVSVEDTGIGIAPIHQEMVFEDFQQVDSSPTRPYGGTGLGLSICRRLARMLDGRITLESTPGQGSTFTLHLPRCTRRT
jgi:two-component system, cell cycle sensor histidine kinase PleC